MSFLHDIESYSRALKRCLRRPKRSIWMQFDDSIVTLYTIHDCSIHDSLEEDFLCSGLSACDEDQSSHKQLGSLPPDCRDIEHPVRDGQTGDNFDCHPEQFNLIQVNSTLNMLEANNEHLNATQMECLHKLTADVTKAKEHVTILTQDLHSEVDSALCHRDCFLWFQTSYLSVMHDFDSGKRYQPSSRFMAVRMKREGFDEIMRFYADDVTNNRQSGDIAIKWVSDLSPVDHELQRCNLRIGVRLQVLNQLRSTWTREITDISQYVWKQRLFVKQGYLSKLCVPYENIYQSSYMSTDFCKILGLQLFQVPVTKAPPQICTENLQDNSVLTCHEQEIILYLYGAFNPIHLGHVKAIDACRKWLSDTKRCNVCATVIGIASDENIEYKFSKSKEFCIAFNHRKRLCELACSNYPAISIWPFPCNGQMQLGELIRDSLKKPGATMGILLGSDHAIRAGFSCSDLNDRNIIVLCVARGGMSNEDMILLEKWKKSYTSGLQKINIVPTKTNDISSTSIRRKLKQINVDYSIDGTMHSNLSLIIDEMIEKEWITQAEGNYIHKHYNDFQAPQEESLFSTCREVQLNRHFVRTRKYPKQYNS